MGRRPAPEAVKQQKAAVRSTRSAPVIPQIEAAGIAAPDWLKDEGLAMWARLAPTLSAAKLLSGADVQTFGRYCRNFARWLKLQKELDAEGETYLSQSKHGDLKRANPVFLIADRVERQLLAAEDRFGLNPAERQRIFVARAAGGRTGDLFPEPQKPREGDPAAQKSEPAAPLPSPIGMLN
jgi:P27 family predicted phage terminase small subunit